MAREIKFRQPIFTNGVFEGFHYWGFIERGFYGPITNSDTSIRQAKEQSQQSTGLKDKHGIEIFEGDVLKKMGSDFDVELDYDANPDAEYPIIEIGRDVATMERFPVFWLRDETFGYEGEDLENSDEWEIIGNVFENPELLENQK